MAEKSEQTPPGFVDLVDRAGCGASDRTAKVSALATKAAPSLPFGKSVDVVSEGMCLVSKDQQPSKLPL